MGFILQQPFVSPDLTLLDLQPYNKQSNTTILGLLIICTVCSLGGFSRELLPTTATVDGKNPAPPAIYKTLQIMG